MDSNPFGNHFEIWTKFYQGVMESDCKVHFQQFWIEYERHWLANSYFFGSAFFLYTGLTCTNSSNSRTERKVDEFLDMFTKFDKKRENKSIFSFKLFGGMFDT